MADMRLSRPILGLRLAIVLLVLVPLLAVFGVGGTMVLNALESRLESRLQEDISLIARTLRVPMARALKRDRQRDVDRALYSAFDFGRVYGVYVYDRDGELVTRADRQRSRVETVSDFPETNDLEASEDVGDYRRMGGQEVFSYFTPLSDTGGQVVGMLQITRQVSEMRDYINELRRRVIVVLVGFGFLLVVIVIAGHYLTLGRSMSRLSRTMEDVAAGDGAVRAEPTGPQEVRMLGERFNTMLDGIEERDRTLEAQRIRQQALTDKLRESEKYALAGRLAAGLAHELGTPLAVIDGHIQRLRRRQQTGPASEETLSRMQSAAGRMAEVVRHLLGFGRGLSAPPRDVSVAKLVSLAAADARTRFSSAGVRPEIAPADRDATVRGDESRLREALSHLLRNAVQAVPRGRVSIGWEIREDSARIVVEDSGAGISEEDRERIFEPFFTTKAPGEGSGLGLAVVRGIVAEHDGEIAVGESRLGGAAFEITLPLAHGSG